MKQIAIIVAAIACAGCTVTRFESGGVKLTRWSFLQAPEIGTVTLSTNSATMSGYKGQDIAPLAKGIAEGITKGLMP
jgi:hypothetical protein